MKQYYISGIYYDGDFEESFEKIITAESRKLAEFRIPDYFDFDRIVIENCYETSNDAML